MDSLLKDLKQSLRMFAKRPAFTLAAVAALTLGIGVNTAVFSVVNAVLLRPVAFPDPDRLVLFMNVSPQGSGAAASPAKFQHYRAQTSVVDDVSAFNIGVVNYTGGSSPEQVTAGRVSAGFFKLFGAPVRYGRPFTAAEDRPGGDKVVILDRSFWVDRFQSDPNVLGQTISLSGDSYTIVGILGDFHFEDFGARPKVWLPFQLDPNSTDQGHYFQAAGRLKPGITLGQAQAQLRLSAETYRRKYPNALGPNQSFTVQPIGEALVRNVRSSLLVLATAVGFVLLIACANVANLLLARATERRREIAIRAAIGGSRARIVRQLLSESVALSFVGGAFGLGLGLMGIRALLAVNTAGLPRVGADGASVGLDWRVVIFTLVISVVTGVLFGLIPALASSRADLTTTLKESAGRSGTGGSQGRTRSVLVVAEVALAMVLLIGSALLIRTSVALGRVDPGFDATHVLTMDMSLTGPRFLTAAGVEQAVHDGLERVRAIPGVIIASATCCVPLQGGYGLPFTIVGRALPQGQPFTGGGTWATISPGYFDVFRIPVKRGRAFDDRDRAGATPVVVINETMAHQFWKSSDPLNDRLIIGRGVMREFADEPERQIVGIVGDTRDGGLDSDPNATMYIPQAQEPDAVNALNVRLSPMAWVVRTQGDPHAYSQSIQDRLRQSMGLPVTNVRSMEEVVSLSTSRQRFNMWLMSVFGLAALLLAAIGIYGLMAYSVEQRTQEIGIRLALGAGIGQVRRMVILQGTVLALAGTAAGVGAALVLVHFVSSISALLFGVRATDPLVFVGTPLVLVLVSVGSVWVPAVRASRVDPTIAMRTE